MDITLLAIMTFTSAVLAFNNPSTTLDGLERIVSAVDLTRRQETCEGFEGNSDFYGLGIRIGVYLQWFSSWISNTVNPDGAASNHDANTVFLIAILIATTVALTDGSLKLAEAYVLLLMSGGFVFTVLSFLGLRLQFLQPSSSGAFRKTVSRGLEKLSTSESAERREPQHSQYVSGLLPTMNTLVLKLVPGMQNSFGLSSFSGLKHASLSWAGVMARSTVGTLLAILSILAWWKYARETTLDSVSPCVPRIYFFGTREIRGASDSLLWFFKIMAILLAIPVGYLFLLSAILVREIIYMSEDYLMQRGIVKISSFLAPLLWDPLSERTKEMVEKLGSILVSGLDTGNGFNLTFAVGGGIPYGFPMVIPVIRRSRPSPTEDANATPGDHTVVLDSQKLPPYRGFLRSLMSLWARGIETTERAESSPGEPANIDKCLCLAAHTLTGVMLACFILFIKKTILVAGVSGVHTIGTTGQLIPFVVGIASMAVAKRELLMLLLKRRYPDWSKYHLALDLSTLGLEVRMVDENGNVVNDNPSSGAVPDG